MRIQDLKESGRIRVREAIYYDEWWITNTGHLLDARFDGHKFAARAYMKYKGENVYETAYGLGWIRIVVEPTLLSADWRQHPPVAALKRLRKMIMDNPQTENLF